MLHFARMSVVLGMFVLSGALFGGPVGAHSKGETTVPADGAVLTDTPPVIAMTFDAPMRITVLRLTDGAGEEHDVERHSGLDAVMELSATPAPLPAGDYTVEWRGLSADGHPMSGAFGFTVSN